MRGNYRNPAGAAPPTEIKTAHEVSPRLGSPKKYDFMYPEQVEICRRMSRVWVAHLSHAEFKLVAWIVGNTILRGNRSGCYSIPQICNGIPDRQHGGMQAEGTGLSPRSVTSITASLRERGLIHTEITARGTVFSIVPSWNPATGKAEESNVVPLNLPRTARYLGPKTAGHIEATVTDSEWDEAPATIAGGHLQPLQDRTCNHCDPSNELPTNSSPTNEGYEDDAPRRLALPAVRKRVCPASPVQRQPPQPVTAGVEEPTPHCAAPPPAERRRFDPRNNVADAIQAAGQLRAKRLAEARKKMDVRSFEVTWDGACAEAYPGQPIAAWTVKQAGMLKRTLKASWPKRHEGQVHDFLHWAVVNWDVILGAKLGWMQKSAPPTKPCIEFVARFLRNFQEAWADKEELRWRGTQDGVKQEAHALAKRERITIEVATARVIAERASERDRAAIARMTARASRDAQLAMMAADRARATRFTKENPHPRAHERVHEAPVLAPGEVDWAALAATPVFFNEDAL